jgi:DNA-binding response OmpR family regulator
LANILIIDDEQAVRKMLRMSLIRAGHEVAEAEDGEAGLREFRQNPPDLVITDIVMPGKDGLETIMELWRENPDVRIIAISGGGARISTDLCLEHARIFGAVKTLSKPVDRQVLLSAIDEVLARTADRD